MIYAQVYAFTKKYKPNQILEYDNVIRDKSHQFKKEWAQFEAKKSREGGKFQKTYFDKTTNTPRQVFNAKSWYRSSELEKDVINYFQV